MLRRWYDPGTEVSQIRSPDEIFTEHIKLNELSSDHVKLNPHFKNFLIGDTIDDHLFFVDK